MHNMSLSHRPLQNTNNDQTAPPMTVFMWQFYYPCDQNGGCWFITTSVIPLRGLCFRLVAVYIFCGEDRPLQ